MKNNDANILSKQLQGELYILSHVLLGENTEQVDNKIENIGCKNQCKNTINYTQHTLLIIANLGSK